SPDQARVARAQVAESRPPHVVPGGGPATLPHVQEFGYLPAGPLAQRAQRAGVEVDPVPEDRELAPVARQGVRGGGSGATPRQVACQGHRRSIYRWNDDARELAGLLRAPGAPRRAAPAARPRSAAPRLAPPRCSPAYCRSGSLLRRHAAERKAPARLMPGATVSVGTLTNYWHGSTDPGAMPRGSRARIA